MYMDNIIDSRRKTETHPCYNAGANDYARLHIPVAPVCNIECKYCDRRYDCPNETRPGVTSEILSPEKAFEKYLFIRSKLPYLSVVGIAGPGDALANFTQVRQSIELIKSNTPDMTFCISTNGLCIPDYGKEIVKLGITHVTITINCVDPAVGADIYNKVNYRGKNYTGKQAARILINNQLEGLKYLARRGVICKVNIIAIKGINISHIGDIVKTVKDYGAYMVNIVSLIPLKNTDFAGIFPISNEELNKIKKKYEKDIKQMYHCRQCRSDAVGCLAEDLSKRLTREYNLMCKG